MGQVTLPVTKKDFGVLDLDAVKDELFSGKAEQRHLQFDPIRVKGDLSVEGFVFLNLEGLKRERTRKIVADRSDIDLFIQRFLDRFTQKPRCSVGKKT